MDYTKNFDRRIAEQVRLEILSLLQCSTLRAMDAALLEITRRILAEIQRPIYPDEAMGVGIVHEYTEEYNIFCKK